MLGIDLRGVRLEARPGFAECADLGMDGFETFRRLMRHASVVQVIFLTAWTEMKNGGMR